MKLFLVELWDDLLWFFHLVRLSEAVQVEREKKIALDLATTLQRELANMQEQFRTKSIIRELENPATPKRTIRKKPKTSTKASKVTR